MNELNGHILVQGASRGIGLAMVEQLLRLSAVTRVTATSRAPHASEALQALGERHGRRLRCVALDVTHEPDIQACMATLRDQREHLHGVINTAGLLHERERGIAPEKRIESLDISALAASFQVNCFGPMLMAKHGLDLLRHDKPAFFASLSARVGSIEDNHLGGWYSYRAAKAAQNQFTRTLAVEAARRARHLRVLALHPGTTDTGLSAPFQRNVPPERLFSPDFAAAKLLGIIADTDAGDSGRFIAWDGQDIPW